MAAERVFFTRSAFRHQGSITVSAGAYLVKSLAIHRGPAVSFSPKISGEAIKRHCQLKSPPACGSAPRGVVGWDDDICSRPHAGYRFPSEIISHAVWRYFRFPPGLRMVEELLAARGIIVSHETVRSGRANSASLSPTRSGAACRELATNGIWTRSCSRSPV